jgi:hypothetical protein
MARSGQRQYRSPNSKRRKDDVDLISQREQIPSRGCASGAQGQYNLAYGRPAPAKTFIVIHIL